MSDPPDDSEQTGPGVDRHGDPPRSDPDRAYPGGTQDRRYDESTRGNDGVSGEQHDEDSPVVRDRTQPGSTSSDRPPTMPGSGNTSTRADRILRYLFDIASSIFVVAAIGGLLFAASGVWPPLVAIESGSMNPHMQKGDLVFVMEEQRFPGAGAESESGVVTAAAGADTGYRMFGKYGDVIVYQPYGSTEETPIIHRAMLWVDEGENWYERADSKYVGNADSCAELNYCPAPHAGFITKGDNPATNDVYDQVMGLSKPVKPSWIMGTAEKRIPWLGQVRLMSGAGSASSINATGS
ncbi:S26 family signal peptidase [Halorhabdus salina]|uniref:S26 family signal peptidase n=1 Tax=Halorhabdus salina TaxID=2750670 RepID=UPI0015EF5987